MLTWRHEGDGWHADGYIIRLAEPFRWILTKAEPESSSVSIPVAPLATARTLTEAKLATIEQRIEALSSLRDELATLVRQCRESDHECPIIARIEGSAGEMP